MKKCILAFNTWETFVFLSNFYVSLTPKPTLINKQIKNYISTMNFMFTLRNSESNIEVQ